MDDEGTPTYGNQMGDKKTPYLLTGTRTHTHRLLGDDNDYLRQQFDQETLEFGHKSRLKQNVEQKI